MDRFFGLDSPVMRALSLVADLVILNLLWLICCIPVVTIGASTTAMYAVALKLAAGQDGYVLRRFFRAFKQNFKQATVIHLITGVLILILFADYTFYLKGFQVPKPLLVLVFATGILLAAFLSWVYPVLSRFDNSVKNTCKNAGLMAVAHLPFTLLILALNLVCPLLFGLYTALFFKWLIVWILCGGSVIAYLNSFALNHCFKRYIPEEILEKEQADLAE